MTPGPFVMIFSSWRAPAAFAFMCVPAGAAFAAEPSGPGRGPPAPSGWEMRVGAGVLTSPAYPGADVYHLNLLPALRLSYGDRFFASVEEGVGYKVVNRDRWTAGPLMRVDFGRDEDTGGPFRIAGRKTNALRGLGNLPATIEGGAFASYDTGPVDIRLEARRGFNGHDGFIVSVSASYVHVSRALSISGGAPAILSFGPRFTFADARYRQAYFGVDAAQSARSGLSVYRPGGGATGVGAGGIAIIPVAPRVSLTLIAGYERLLGVGGSPLIARGGSVHQLSGGVFISRSFSLGG